MDRPTQLELQTVSQNFKWSLPLSTPDGRAIVVRSVVYEACDDDDHKGGALLISDEATGAVLSWQTMGSWDAEGTKPIWAVFLHPKSDEFELFSYSHCLECSPRTSVYYDVRRKKIYFEYNGA